MASIYAAGNGGGWVAQVNVGGRRRSKKFETKRDAQRWARQEEAATDKAGKAPARSDLRFSDVIAEYLDAVGDMSRSKTGALTHIAELLGRRKLAGLDVRIFRDFAATRAAEGAGPATISQDMTYIHGLLATGGPLLEAPVEAPLAALAAARKVLGISGQIARPRERSRRPTDAELLSLRDFWARRRRGIPMWTLTQFSIASAMRLSEITRIAWADLEVAGRTILIRDRKHPRSKKGNDQRVPLLHGPVTIDGAVIDPLALILAQPKGEPRIFPYGAATVSTSFTRAVASCGIEDLHLHDLRHDGCSRLFEAGYGIEQVALVSGHRDWNQLRRYTNLKAESLHRSPVLEAAE